MSTSSNGRPRVRPLDIVISGAGIGGLSAAIELRLQGHRVKVFEQSRFAYEIGAAINLAPNANGLLRRLGVIPEDSGAVETEWMCYYEANGDVLSRGDTAYVRSKLFYPWQMIHRVDLHSKLKEVATSPANANANGKLNGTTPVEIFLSSKTVGVDFEDTALVMENGERHKGDFIIAADGIHSPLRALINHQDPTCRPFPSGRYAYRFLLPIAEIKADPETASLVERKGELALWADASGDRKVVLYPCRGNTLLNFVCIYKDQEVVGKEAGREGWSMAADKQEMISKFSGFNPALLKLFGKADPASLRLWTLLDCPLVKNWFRGNVALLGDAAHPFLPYQGQGGAQALEDAAAIGALFPLGTKPSDIQERLELYVKCRYERAGKIQEATRATGDGRITYSGAGGAKIAIDSAIYTHAHDAYHHATLTFNRHTLSKKESSGLYHRMPISFGPFPGPRQDAFGNPRETSTATYQTASVTFKTSKTFLETLLPNDGFVIGVMGTIAFATVSCRKFAGLDWLGGRGYSQFGLYIHDVVYTSTSTTTSPSSTGDHETVKGKYLVVLFENMADPIISGREELGYPKLYATLDPALDRENGTYTLDAGWEGTSFCKLELPGLSPPESPPVEKQQQQEGILQYKYIPATGYPGKADVEYATFSPPPPPEAAEKITETLVTSSDSLSRVKVAFGVADGVDEEKELPTLWHIVRRLAEMPVGEVVAADVVCGSGVQDFVGQRRVV